MSKIPLSKCFVNAEVEEAALRAIRSGQYILGKESTAFEAELAAHTGTAQCVLGSSWTMIVYCLHQLQGIGPGDEIIVPSHTAFPTMEPLIHLGAKPVFADIDETYVMDLAHVESLITPRTVGIIGVHLYGHPIDNDKLLAIAKKNKLWVIEDCAQAQGAKYKGKTVGTFGEISCFSFYPGKNLGACGEGGALLTNNPAFDKRARALREHGSTVRYYHDEVGYNYRMEGFQGAVLGVKLKHLAKWTAERRRVAHRYHELLAGTPLQLPREAAYAESAYHVYVVRHPQRDQLKEYLDANGVGCALHYPLPLHLQKCYASLGYKNGDFPISEKAARECLSLPIFPGIKAEAGNFAERADNFAFVFRRVRLCGVLDERQFMFFANREN